MKKRIVSLVLATGILSGMLVGCGGASSSESVPPAPSSQSVSADPASMYPVEGSPKLQYWLPIHPNATKYISSYSENEAYQEIQKRTGIEIEFQHPATGQVQEQFNLLFTSNRIPDIIQSADLYAGGIEKGYQDGAYIDLTPYLQEYAPDYYNLIMADEELQREIFTEDGKILAFYKIRAVPDPPWCRALARKDWLEEFGMEPPTTLEEYEAYFQAVKENKPDAAPLMLPSTDADINQIEIFYGAFDMLPGWYVVDGKIHYGNGDPQLKEYLTVMHDWYEKGYISSDFASVEQNQIWAMFDAGQLGMYVDAVAARNEVMGKVFIGLPYPRQTIDSKYHAALANWPCAGDATAISTSCKDIENAMKFLNYAYTEEGSMLYNYGIEGVTYNMVDGKPKYTDYILNNPKFDTAAANYILRIHFAPKYMPGSPLEFNPTMAKDEQAVADRMRFCDDPNVDSAFRIPPIKYTPEETKEIASIMTNVKTYSQEMIMKFITGAESLDNFDAYIEQVNAYGLDRAVELTQNAYDRYMN